MYGPRMFRLEEEEPDMIIFFSFPLTISLGVKETTSLYLLHKEAIRQNLYFFHLILSAFRGRMESFGENYIFFLVIAQFYVHSPRI